MLKYLVYIKNVNDHAKFICNEKRIVHYYCLPHISAPCSITIYKEKGVCNQIAFNAEAISKHR